MKENKLYYLVLLLLGFERSGCVSVTGAWPQVIHDHQPNGGIHKVENYKKKEDQVTWTPDPKELLGLYEEEQPTRNTNAYFMTKNNTVVTVQVGSTAALRCQVYDVAEHETVSWIRRRDHHIITVGSKTHSNDGRFQVTNSKKLQDWTLHIHFAQPRDTGIYECQLSAHPPIGILTSLKVIEAITEMSGGSERYIQVGSSVHLVCTIRELQEPPTYVFWYHGEEMINYDTRRQITVNTLDGKSELEISEVSPKDSGNYTCAPSNARHSSVSLHVITGETPAAMQRASGTGLNHPLSLAILTSLLPILAS